MKKALVSLVTAAIVCLAITTAQAIETNANYSFETITPYGLVSVPGQAAPLEDEEFILMTTSEKIPTSYTLTIDATWVHTTALKKTVICQVVVSYTPHMSDENFFFVLENDGTFSPYEKDLPFSKQITVEDDLEKASLSIPLISKSLLPAGSYEIYFQMQSRTHYENGGGGGGNGLFYGGKIVVNPSE